LGDPALENLLLAFSERTGIQSITLFSPWGWPIVEILHFTGLCLLFGTIGLFDLRVLGWAKRIPLDALHRLVPIGVAGFCINAITGVMFVTSDPDQYLYNPAVQTKMALLLLAGVNMLLFYALASRELRALGPGEPAPFRARTFTLVSLLAWTGVIACGRLITFYRPPFFWCFWC
jgi:hypothetical protein